MTTDTTAREARRFNRPMRQPRPQDYVRRAAERPVRVTTEQGNALHYDGSEQFYRVPFGFSYYRD